MSLDERPRPLRYVRNFRLFWLSRILSGAGSAVAYVAMPVLVYEKTHSPLLVSFVAAGEAMPYVFFGLLAGALADRLDRRRIMVAADLANSVCLTSVPLAAATHSLTTVHIVAVAFVSSTLYVFFDAAGYGVVPAVVGRERLAQANSLIWGGETTVRIIGTAMAGLLIGVLGTTGALALQSVTFLISALLVGAMAMPTGVRTAPSENLRILESIKEGVQFLWRQPALRIMTVCGCLQSFAGGAFLGQLVIFADRDLGLVESDSRIGLLFTAWSVGGVLGSIALPRLLRKVDAMHVMRVALPASAGLGLLTTTMDDWRFALPTITAWGTVYLMIIVNTVTYAQSVTPEPLQGRVNATRRMLSSGIGAPGGAMMAGFVTAAFSVRSGLLMAVAAVGLAAVFAWSMRPTSGDGPDARTAPSR
ncbi:MFS transporter [Streptomyces sp. NBC_00536]|uniref:MFS transporter n=1 Tax=Streptomyces sp. NBC_00536 TaxID=2975769 RepID=UPI002E813A46|nr:MFS transporter [Streptomyces sp. NBC_00536]WUC76897.1 MFS transporter [Streptomyces sp. NBC_00536]